MKKPGATVLLTMAKGQRAEEPLTFPTRGQCRSHCWHHKWQVTIRLQRLERQDMEQTNVAGVSGSLTTVFWEKLHVLCMFLQTWYP